MAIPAMLGNGPGRYILGDWLNLVLEPGSGSVGVVVIVSICWRW